MADIKIIFRGDTFVIPDTKAFMVGEIVEEIASLPEVFSWLKAPRYFKMARCLGAMLRFAGSRATDEEVHAEFMTLLAAGRIEELAGSIYMLTAVLMHGAPEAKPSEDAPSEKESAL